jgi:hypothetical protein
VTTQLASHGERIEELGVEGICKQLLQIAADYSSLPDLRKITVDEIRFFYEPLIPGLNKMYIESNKK